MTTRGADVNSIMQTPAEVLAFRRLFPGLSDNVHLASNAKGALSEGVIEAHAAYLDSWREHGAPWHEWIPKYFQLRDRFAAMIGAQPHEVALCASATAAVASVASAIDWSNGRDGVVVDDYNFPSVMYSWYAQTARGAQVHRVAPDSAGEICPDAFDAVLNENVRLLSVASVCYTNGYRLDLPEIAQRAHAAGAWLVVDDYQCAGTRPIDVRAMGIDVLTTGTLKFMLGSPGVAFLYVAEELLEQLHPTVTGWFGQRDPNDFQIERHIEAPGAARFQVGTPAISPVYDSLAGLEVLLSVGLEPIEDWIGQLTGRLIEELEREGFVSATPRELTKRGPLVAIQTRSGEAERVVQELAERAIVTSSREDFVRCGFHFYNTFEDIEALLSGLRALEPLMARK